MSEKLEALSAAKFLEFSMNKMPKCPHCGSDFDIDRNEAWRVYDENDRHDVNCPTCERDFLIQSHADWRFSTDEQDDD